MGIAIKICGLTTHEAVRATAESAAAYAGFVFFEKSPRHVSPARASELAQGLGRDVARVALTVNAADAVLDEIVQVLSPDLLQLHGKETPERVAEIKARYGLPVMKAIPVAEADDLKAAESYTTAADLLLFDAKPPKSMRNALPGGNGLAFDWALIAAERPKGNWMLSGGLTPENVAEAVRISKARAVDVSSGVEFEPGLKDPALIKAFCQAARLAAPV